MNRQGYIKSLDGVRGLAILLVMSFHAGLNHFGWMGVQLFFVLSGYLITGILWKEKERKEGAQAKLGRFWIRRSLRIFPLYFTYLLVLGISYLILHFPSYYPTYAPYLFTYTANYSRLLPEWQGNPLFTHLWSLSIEEQFYVFFPLLVFFSPAKFARAVMISLIVLSPLIRYFLFAYYQTRTSSYVAADAVYWNTLSHLDAFFMGGLIPVLSLDKKVRRPGLLLLIALAIAVVAGLLHYVRFPGSSYWADLGYNHDQVEGYAHVWRYSCLDILFASLLLVLKSGKVPITTKFFEQGWLVRVGRVSYGMYIFHWLIFVYVFARLTSHTSRLLLFIPYALAVYLVAEISYRLYESWFLKWKDRAFSAEGRKPAA